MRLALPGSALVHLLALGAGLLMFNWSDPEDAPAASAVSVDVIAMASVSANQTSTVESDATETLVSSGAQSVAATPPETVEPAETEMVQPTDAAPVETSVAEALPQEISPSIAPVAPTTAQNTDATPVEPIAAEPLDAQSTPETPAEVQPESSQPVEALDIEPVLSVAAIDPVETQTITPQAADSALAPVETTDVKVAPVPHVLTRPRPNTPSKAAPTQRTASAQPSKPPAKTQPTRRPRQQPAAPAGNGGQNQADSVASKPAGGQQGNTGSGGDAAVAKYPSQVLGKLRRALRYPGGAGGASGEVHVQFVVAANGSPSGMRIVQSSGNAAIDRAGIDTVSRAAPFPPIPAGVGRDTWLFTIPLAFER